MKQSRDGSKRKSKRDYTRYNLKCHEMSDTTTNIILAATRALEQHWLAKLAGWAPNTDKKYQMYSTIKDIPKSLYSEGYYSQNRLADYDLDL